MTRHEIIDKIGSKKFLYVLPTLGIGGAELQTINQLNYFQENEVDNFNLAILSDKIDEKCASSLMLPKSKIFVLGSKGMGLISAKSLLSSFKSVRKLSRIIRETETKSVIAILLASQFITRLTKLYHFVTLKPKFEIISYYRGLDYQLFLKKNIFLKIFNSANKALAYLVDNKSIFISKAVKDDIVRNFYVNKKNTVIYNSLPERLIDSTSGYALLYKLGIDKNTFVIVVPGTIHAASKGQFFFVEAFKSFINKESLLPENVKVIIAGDGTDFDALKSLIVKYNLTDYFFMSGAVENKDLLSLFKTVNLVVVPSISEGFGNVVIEALSQQVLILASDTGGIPEIIIDRKNGLLFKSNNIESLVEKLTYVYVNRGTQIIDDFEMINSFKSNFTLQAQIKSIVEVLSC